LLGLGEALENAGAEEEFMQAGSRARQRLVAGLLGTLCWVVLAPAHAQWAWKDDNGRVVYSDRPPPAAVKADRIVRQPSNAQTVLPQQAQPAPATDTAKPAATPAPSSGPKSAAEQEMEFRKRQQERADAEKKAQEEQSRAAAKATECERARSYLKAIEDGQRIARTDASGNREFLDDAQRAAEAERARKIMQSTCS
jgi:type IV secretory pathway VirB10-like protein